jgi:type VI protein secretion system component VasA
VSFNHYYQSELTALRQLGRRFAERSPALAPYLGQAGRDPDVERLLKVLPSSPGACARSSTTNCPSSAIR